MSDVEDYLKKNIFGTPQLKPDERKKFLGNFQERVALALTVAQVRNPKNLPLIKRVMQRYPQYHLYINGRMSTSYRQELIRLAVTLNYQFTIIAQKNRRLPTLKLSEQEMGLVIADDRHKVTRPTLL